jgi:hypothetical protein
VKHLFFLFIIIFLISSCQNKKIETVATDTLAVDTVAAASAPQLAFSPLENYFLKNTATLADSVNFFIFANQSEFDDMFAAANNKINAPDFIINHHIAIALLPTQNKTTIEIEKIELGESTINVFAKIKKGEKENATFSPAQAFAIEKRDGVTGMDFYLDDRKVKSLMLPVF